MWGAMFQGEIRAQLATNYYAIPLMLENDSVLILHTTFRDQDKYLSSFYYDLAKNPINRMAFGLARDLKNTRIAVVAAPPGWMRTELVLANFRTDEDHWREVEALNRAESPYYIGRAVSALARDGQVHHKTGQVLQVGELSREYGITDMDGRCVRRALFVPDQTTRIPFKESRKICGSAPFPRDPASCAIYRIA